MYIHEAIRAMTPEKPYIHRLAWDEKLFPGRHICVEATDSLSCCLSYSVAGPLGPCWNPRRADLLADDWEPCPPPPATKIETAGTPEERTKGFSTFWMKILGHR